MMLLVDSGNTRLKWGLWHQGGWLERGVFDNEHLPEQVLAWQGAASAVVCWVSAPPVLHWLERQLQGRPLTRVGARAVGWGVRNGYAEPAQLGADRWAALVAARGQSPSAALVVNAGTAVTIDAMAADGRYLGGIIVSGLQTMQSALRQRAPHLPAPGGEWQLFPGNTLDALYSGAVQAIIGAITLQWQALAAQSDEPPRCYLGGGDASLLQAHLAHLPLTVLDDLVLRGLVRMVNEPA